MARKKVSKKASSRVTRQKAEKLLADVPEEYAFWCCDGRILRNMRELAGAFNVITDEVFAYHSNSEKSDFSNWVGDIIRDEKLARDLRECLSREQAEELVAERVAFIEANLAG